MTKCIVGGCLSHATGLGLCASHGGIERSKRSKRIVRDHHTLYNTGRWKRLRLSALSANPLCQRCKHYGKLTPAIDVDHIVPHKGDHVLFSDANNIQCLCKSCHSWKTQRESTLGRDELDWR